MVAADDKGMTAESDRRTELRTATALVAAAGADLGCGEEPEVRVLADGRLWLADVGAAVSAHTLYRAAQSVLAAQLAATAELTGEDVEAVTFGWLVTLQMHDVLHDLAVRDGSDADLLDDAA